MRKHCRVLVTGAGSGVGQGIIKALRLSELPITVIGADIAPMNAALYRAEEAVIIPRVEDVGSLEVVIEILRQNNVDVVMIGSEFELSFFSENKERIEGGSGAIVIAAPLNTIQIADDKWLTAEFLRQHGLAYAESYLPSNADNAVEMAGRLGYPLVLKTRRGTSSRHVYIVKEEGALRERFATTPLPMLQRMIDLPSSELNTEYTCSIFKTPSGRLVGPFTARRTVRGGTSWHIEVARFEVLHEVLLSIGREMDFTGSLNVQLMLTADGPVPFELNARFSGTTAVRAHFGFNEPDMALRSFFYGEEFPDPIIGTGVAMRYHEEVFIDHIGAEGLRPGIHKGYVAQWF
jgi:carbamoyl-phosphate synthase large subunit